MRRQAAVLGGGHFRLRRGRAPHDSGFTLLEVLVAVAILGLGLTMILSSQVGLFSSAARAEHLTIATNLARCRMTELELELLQKGYQLIDQNDEGPCCDDEDEPGYRCSTKVERVELPEATELQTDEAGAEGSTSSSDLMSSLGKLSEQQSTNPGDPGSFQAMAAEVASSSEAAGLGPMIFGMVYPALKPMLEASIRKVTVSVHWKEGKNEKDFNITQFVTRPQQPPEDLSADTTTGNPSTGGS